MDGAYVCCQPAPPPYFAIKKKAFFVHYIKQGRSVPAANINYDKMVILMVMMTKMTKKHGSINGFG